MNDGLNTAHLLYYHSQTCSLYSWYWVAGFKGTIPLFRATTICWGVSKHEKISEIKSYRLEYNSLSKSNRKTSAAHNIDIRLGIISAQYAFHSRCRLATTRWLQYNFLKRTSYSLPIQIAAFSFVSYLSMPCDLHESIGVCSRWTYYRHISLWRSSTSRCKAWISPMGRCDIQPLLALSLSTYEIGYFTTNYHMKPTTISWKLSSVRGRLMHLSLLVLFGSSP